MTNSELTEIFSRIHKERLAGKYKKIEAVFHPYRSMRHTLEWTPWRIGIKVSEQLQGAPALIIESLAIILLSKVYKRKVDRNIRKCYQEFVAGLERREYNKNTYGLGTYRAEGKIYDLERIFDELNQEYFEPNLQRPHFGWSKSRSYTRLGFYDGTRNLIVISSIFDDNRVPEDIVKYLVYHEMLHIYYPTHSRNGRRVIHSKAFRETEKKFKNYKGIQHWIKHNVRKL